MGRFKFLVESEEDRERFRAKYRIPPIVGMRYVTQGEWVNDRKEGKVVILMITFIEEGMTISMGNTQGSTLDSLDYPPHNVPQACLGYWGV